MLKNVIKSINNILFGSEYLIDNRSLKSLSKRICTVQKRTLARSILVIDDLVQGNINHRYLRSNSAITTSVISQHGSCVESRVIHDTIQVPGDGHKVKEIKLKNNNITITISNDYCAGILYPVGVCIARMQ